MIHRLFALLALTSRRLSSASDYTADLRVHALATGSLSGLSAAATTRW
jgi:hypothetical protein